MVKATNVAPHDPVLTGFTITFSSAAEVDVFDCQFAAEEEIGVRAANRCFSPNDRRFTYPR
jgi:hypothetical protein